ncbi:UDP-N-acetylmuramoyl-L-alanine--D-glutamate ligase [Vagococcus xieshaowenii]|uniref:UDP-N-acetylmuramoylalanine--D-glutamate ligase n=1 Tax=Vagococcus xieshaowenii TaxID=2562451 RepID=A0AAJ5EGB0_9ENTE|nr:UDP-N-acetylmuramoyl-L-alanine--D-glutamate ligase [Vagococcus xieshaowenii]QCA28990.1 UDP-N-acetylmuramoyl-L-alanine--D-glutamate ligase [Vagococcus xieshaowenii]TFZ43171.1 UDP-N-acetylmuramoyl-L-alanine--D-glutamate ligase [Vagococcus xieshaowenii]
MKVISNYQNKKVLVLGLAKSGTTAARLLHQLGAIVTVNDGKPLEENIEAQELLELGIKVIAGSHPIELLDEEFELLVKNPGIPYTNPMIQVALEKQIPVITEVELAYEISEAPIIGITGTNGKTTTTTMINNLLNADKQTPFAFVAGNIGQVASQVAQEVSKDNVMVTELSSFQLMGIETFKPKVAVIVNIFEAHLDYHGNREEYVKAKWEIQKNMTESDYLILNYNQEELRLLGQRTNATVIPFSTKEKYAEGAYVENDKIFFKEEFIMLTHQIGVPGEHNVENALAAISVAKLYNISNEEIITALSTFGGVSHRMEFVGNVLGRKVYNDSKATNILATQTALSAFKDKKDKVILIAGGLDRGNDFVELESSLENVKAISLYGETKDKLAISAKSVEIVHISINDHLDEAVRHAFEYSDEGDILLFSPACASWDQFKNFEIRGDQFKQAIKNIEEEWNN